MFLFYNDIFYNYYITNNLINKLSLFSDKCNDKIISNDLDSFECINGDNLLQDLVYISSYDKKTSFSFAYNSYHVNYRKQCIEVIYNLFNLAFFNNEIRNI